MIIGDRIVHLPADLVEQVLFCLVGDKLVLVRNILQADTLELLDHSVIPIYSDQPMTRARVKAIVAQGAL